MAKSGSSKVTPSRQQYLDIKAQHPDAIVFFRLGDFYETFDDDAQTAARELDLVLTSRPQGKDQRTPMAGVPHHAAEGYIARLIAKGYKVALGEQIGSETIQGLMPREVVRVFTAGTVIEPGMLEAGRNNYLAAVIREDGRSGLAYADITTGEFATASARRRAAAARRTGPPRPRRTARARQQDAHFRPGQTGVSPLPDWRFEEGKARQTLLRHFRVSSLAGFRLREQTPGRPRRRRRPLLLARDPARRRRPDSAAGNFQRGGLHGPGRGHAAQSGTDLNRSGERHGSLLACSTRRSRRWGHGCCASA